MFSLRILTLNCWGIPIPFICKDQNFRIKCLTTALSKGEYDIILLQEVWLIADFKLIQSTISDKLPYSHYFYSGSIGSGICVFSKFPIIDTLYFDYRLNGYAHKILHGDWFAGKGVGLLKVQANGLLINIYTTHIHAEYSNINDEYFTHRLIQAFQLSQFIKHTSEKCDVVFVGGDCNIESSSLSYKILTTNAMLNDAWLEKKNIMEDEFGGTCECPTNYYTKENISHGKRIDYLLFRANSGTKITVADYETVLGKIPDYPQSFSDHEGVSGTFNLMSAPTAQACPARDNNLLSDHLQAMISEVDKSMLKLSSNKQFWICMAIICTFILFFVKGFNIEEPFVAFIMNVLMIVLVIFIAFSLWTGIIIICIENNAFIATKTEAKYLLTRKKEN